MTIHEITNQLFGLSVDKKFNGETFSKRRLEAYISNMFRPESGPLKIKDRLVMEITLRDGTWFFSVDRFSNKGDGFDYYIPDTREQESRLLSMLTS